MSDYIHEIDLDHRYFSCCGNEGLAPLCCPQCRHRMVVCYECDTLYGELDRLDRRSHQFDWNSSTLFPCPACGASIGPNCFDDKLLRPTRAEWTMDWAGRRLINAYPFPPAWISVDLPGYRRAEATYGTFHYRSLPSLPDSLRDETFQWIHLWPRAETYDSRWSADRFPSLDEYELGRAELIAAAREACVELPAELLTFLFDRELQLRLRSPTDCSYETRPQLRAAPAEMGGWFLPFFIDSQGSAEWAVYFHNDFGHCVVAALSTFEELQETEWDQLHEKIRFCSESFLEFVARMTLESELWFRLTEQHPPLTPAMQTYVYHYETGRDGAWSWDEEEW
ncbi:MAG: hypothetical protein KDA58_00345 [Planctomycetaceae bacterium]|nr:hypothetical protein [Planctomycetaceae bacterium]